MALLAQAYLHLGINMRPPDREAYAEFLRATTTEISRDVYGATVAIRVESAEGSTKFWVSAAAGLAAAIVSYGAFRTGLDYLVKDARELSGRVLQAVEETGIARSEIDVFQRRLGVVGKIQRVMRSLDHLERSGSELDSAWRHSEYSRLKAILFEVLTELETPEDREFLLSHLPEVIAKPVDGEDRDREIPKIPLHTGSRPEEWDVNAANRMTYQAKLDGPHSITYEPLVSFDSLQHRIVRLKEGNRLPVPMRRDDSNS